MAVYFTADTHFDHVAIIDYAERPVVGVAHMNELLIKNWNSVVQPDNVVYHLGDFALGSKPERIQEILRRLNGRKIIILGNHDERTIARKSSLYKGEDLFEDIIPGIHEIKVDGQHIVLSHYALRVWNRSHYGSWCLFGHSHGTLPDDPNALSMDVGVDPNNYTPVSMEQIAAHMSRKRFKPVDHHGGEGTKR